MDSKKPIIGLVENVTIIGNHCERAIEARIDTGATKSSIDESLADELKLGPIMGEKLVKSAHGTRMRPFIDVKIKIAGKEMTATFTIARRDHMKYKVLIGQNILMENFLIDPSKTT